MKKLLSIILITFLLIGCNEATDKQACLMSVKNLLPTCKIYTHINGSYKFVAIDTINHNIYYVETLLLGSSNVSRIDILVKK